MTRDKIDETETPDTVPNEIPDDDENPVAAAIAAAEEIPDPLAGLIERTADDPGAPFAPEVLERISAMKKEDRAGFEALRVQLKKAGCRVTALDKASMEESGNGGRRPTQADILIDLAEAAELFHSADGTAFADLDINGHRETWPVRTKGFKRWLARQFYEATDGAASSEALQSALNVVEAKARIEVSTPRNGRFTSASGGSTEASISTSVTPGPRRFSTAAAWRRRRPGAGRTGASGRGGRSWA